MQKPTEPRDERSTTRATLLLLVSSASYGSISILTVFITREGTSLLSAMLWRFLLASAVLTIVARTEIARTWRYALPLVAVGGLMQASVTYLSLSALRFIPASVLGFLFFTYPAWLAVMGAVRGTDPFTPRRVATLFLAMTGVALMIGLPGGSTGPAGGEATNTLHPIGIALALGSSLLYAIYLPVIDRLQRNIPAPAAAAYVTSGVFIAYLLTAIVTAVIGFLLPWPAAFPLDLPPTAKAWVYVLVLALFSTVIAFRTLFQGLRVLGARRTSIVGTAEPFFTTLLAVVLLGEALRWPTLLGGVLIAWAVILIARERSSQETRGIQAVSHEP